MYTVSEAYKQAIYAPVRRTAARVVFEILDVDAWEDNVKTASSEASISRLDQTTNKNRGMSRKYATLEKNYWALDGSFFLPPEPNESPDLELGWWSGDICGPDGTFDPYQILEFVFTKDHSSMGISIAFDDAANEYAADFDIRVYDAGSGLIKSVSVTDNTAIKYVWMEQLDNYRKVELVIKRWAKPYRRARVVEVDFGVVKEYADDKLIGLNMLKEISLTGENLPAGEIEFTVDNSDREFDILNPAGFYRFLQERQEAKLEMGVEVSPGIFEYVPMGLFYLYDWKSDEGSLTTTFTALEITRILDDFEMENLTAASKSLYSLAEEIMTAAGIDNYEIDTGLQSITTQAFYKKMTARTLLQHICVAGRAVTFTDRDGRLLIKRLTDIEPVDSINFENSFKEPQINLDKLIAAVEVNIYDNGEVDDTYILTNGPKGEIYKVDNPLINDATTAQAVAEWLAGIFSQRAILEVNWRQNPALDLGDIVEVENAYGTNDARITKQEISYQGYMSGRTELSGEIGGG